MEGLQCFSGHSTCAGVSCLCRRGVRGRVGRGLATAGMNPDLDPIPCPWPLGPLSERGFEMMTTTLLSQMRQNHQRTRDQTIPHQPHSFRHHERHVEHALRAYFGSMVVTCLSPLRAV